MKTTKTLEDYMNDPAVAHLQMPLREIKAIRLMIYDEEKDMTPDELKEHYRQFKKNMQEQYGLEFVASAR